MILKVKVKVTAALIKLGQPKSSCTCPIALGLGYALEENNIKAFSIAVNKVEMLAKVNTETVYICHTPHRVSEFISAFDDGRTVDPFEFEIEMRPA